MNSIVFNEPASPEMARAVELWGDGKPLPLDLAAALIGQGYDLDALERSYTK